jgi:hypothetical protein
MRVSGSIVVKAVLPDGGFRWLVQRYGIVIAKLVFTDAAESTGAIRLKVLNFPRELGFAWLVELAIVV